MCTNREIFFSFKQNKTWRKKQQTQCVFNNILLRFNNKNEKEKHYFSLFFHWQTKMYIMLLLFFSSWRLSFFVSSFFFPSPSFVGIFNEILTVWRILLCHVGGFKHCGFSAFLSFRFTFQERKKNMRAYRCRLVWLGIKIIFFSYSPTKLLFMLGDTYNIHTHMSRVNASTRYFRDEALIKMLYVKQRQYWIWHCYTQISNNYRWLIQRKLWVRLSHLM